jgi:hypothetical protein
MEALKLRLIKMFKKRQVVSAFFEQKSTHELVLI